jgi:hypothetical protein
VPRAGRTRREETEEREPRRERGRGRGDGREREPHEPAAKEEVADAGPAQSRDVVEAAPTREEAPGEDPLKAAYGLMTRALEELRSAGRDAVRDSDVKRKMLELNAGFDETELGFSKFSKFLAQAEEHGAVRLTRNEAGNFEVTLEGAGEGRKVKREGRRRGAHERREEAPSLFGTLPDGDQPAIPEPAAPAAAAAPTKPEPRPTVVEIRPGGPGDVGLRLGPRRGSTRRRSEDDALILLPGQAIAATPKPESGAGAPETPRMDAPRAGSSEVGIDAEALGLPTEPAAIVRYLTHRYRGVGEKTAESLVERFGPGLFRVLREDPDAISAAVSPKRAEQVLEAWKVDFERRSGRRSGPGAADGAGSEAAEGRTGERSRRGGRRRGPRGRGGS